MRWNRLVISYLAVLMLTACSKPETWTAYTFKDSVSGVSFRMQYPAHWALTEQPGWDGDALREASPDAGVRFDLAEDETLIVAAMRFAPLTFDAAVYATAGFTADNGMAGTRYTQRKETRVSVYYLFGGEELPQYYAAVNMSQSFYEEQQGEIEQAIKSMEIKSPA